ncbi:Dabb family protein [Methylococcus mesophilus]|uniref:Dabb family protein n=1 Tax=Methylococcus mesophilus TaxID=2993564 RepID=UPI00224B905A|nr:Dabb family protein [Methylococcus mesophilus]UZR30387.1 Dabb family protein [Methylococcus mesophilus]
MFKRFFVFGWVLFGCAFSPLGSSEVIPAGGGRVQHVVIVWLKDHGSPAARQQYIENSRRLGKLPMVLHYRVGTVLTGDRAVVDSSYDVGVVATFENDQALRDYLAHPEHRKVIDESLKPLVDKAVVYDFKESN